MNIGIVTVWFESGAGYVSRQYKNLLEKAGHQVFIFARGGFYPKNDPLYNTQDIFWSSPSPYPHLTSFNLTEFIKWLRENEIQAVFFNEQTWFKPLEVCRDLAIKTGLYVDYYTQDSLPYFDAFDFLICNTKRHYEVFQKHPQSYYVPWGTDTGLFCPRSYDLVVRDELTLFHSCGGDPARKGTDLLIRAFGEVEGNCKLVIHTQIHLLHRWKALDSLIHRLLVQGKLQIIQKTVGAPGLYHLGDVYAYPTRLEGIGLTIAEALACGLPAIVPDDQPMNEFVDDSCGKLVKVEKHYGRSDKYYWPLGEVSIIGLARRIREYADDLGNMKSHKEKARQHAEAKLNWMNNVKLINKIFTESTLRNTGRNSSASLFAYNMYPPRRSSAILYSLSPAVFRISNIIWKKLKNIRLRPLRSRQT